MQTGMGRRQFLAGTAMLAATLRLPATSEPQAHARLILLGTGGGPRPRKASSASAQVIVSNGTAYFVDCGDGVARQLAFARIALPTIRHVFLTHQHSDHNADYGNLILLAWAAGLRTAVHTWGPPPLKKMTRLFLEMNASDITTRIADEGRIPLAPLVHVHELRRGGLILEDGNVKVTAALVHHPPVVPSFGYRFDGADRSIVISGDTTPSANLIEVAQGADILVHEALYAQGVDRMIARVPNTPLLKQSIMSHHTTAEDAGRIANEAGVKLLVLSHLIPPDDQTITDQMWIDAAHVHFRGKVIIGKDLLEI